MRILLLLLLCLCLAREIAGAQALPAEVAAPPAFHTDTATAIHRCYQDRRRLRSRVLLATVGGGALIALVGNVTGPAK